MAYDAETTERTVTRDRVMRLRDHIAALPPEHFNMHHWHCGTVACIGGWAATLFLPQSERYRDCRAAEALGLTPDQGEALFFPTGKMGSGLSSYGATNAQAVAVLTNYLATGEIDWSVAK
jgi:hypothetical protein